ncbi:MAG: hypothetical protein Q8Q81_02190 [Oxalobacteraceae bacterium]|nr:hypothetical protein [Oxalobacteraceae bacterium]
MMFHTLRDTAHALQNANGIIYRDKFGGINHGRQFNDIPASCLHLANPPAPLLFVALNPKSRAIIIHQQHSMSNHLISDHFNTNDLSMKILIEET